MRGIKFSRRVRILFAYTGVALSWLIVSMSLQWNFGRILFPMVFVHVLYIAFSSVLLYWMLEREFTVSHSRHEYDQLLNSMLEPVLIHENEIIVDINLPAIRFFNAHSRHDLVGKSIMQFVPLHYREVVLKRVQQIHNGLSTNVLQEQFITIDDKVRDIEVRGIPVTHAGNPAVLIIFRDITAELLQTERIKESEERYRSLFDKHGDMVVSVDETGIITVANEAAEQVLGYPPSELAGRNYIEFIATDFQQGARKRLPRVLRGEPQDLYIKVVHKHGNLVDIHEKKVPIIVYGKFVGFFWIARDITDQNVADELLIKSERLSAVGEMAASIAHEIRNPLTALLGFVQLMLTSGAQETYLNVMKTELERIDHIVNEMLILSKSTSSSLQLRQESCTHILAEVVDLMDPHAHMKSIAIDLHVESEEIVIMCDKNRIKQVLINLIKNSVEASPPHRGIINVGVYEKVDSVVIYVSDNGSGIPQEVMERIGQPFYTTKTKGTGLGLMVCKRIVEMHHGELLMQNQLEGGVIIEVFLPSVSAWC